MRNSQTINSRQAIYLTITQRDAIARLQSHAKDMCGINPTVHQIARQLINDALSLRQANEKPAAPRKATSRKPAAA